MLSYLFNSKLKISAIGGHEICLDLFLTKMNCSKIAVILLDMAKETE